MASESDLWYEADETGPLIDYIDQQGDLVQVPLREVLFAMQTAHRFAVKLCYFRDPQRAELVGRVRMQLGEALKSPEFRAACPNLASTAAIYKEEAEGYVVMLTWDNALGGHVDLRLLVGGDRSDAGARSYHESKAAATACNEALVWNHSIWGCTVMSFAPLESAQSVSAAVKHRKVNLLTRQRVDLWRNPGEAQIIESCLMSGFTSGVWQDLSEAPEPWDDVVRQRLMVRLLRDPDAPGSRLVHGARADGRSKLAVSILATVKPVNREALLRRLRDAEVARKAAPEAESQFAADLRQRLLMQNKWRPVPQPVDKLVAGPSSDNGVAGPPSDKGSSSGEDDVDTPLGLAAPVVDGGETSSAFASLGPEPPVASEQRRATSSAAVPSSSASTSPPCEDDGERVDMSQFQPQDLYFRGKLHAMMMTLTEHEHLSRGTGGASGEEHAAKCRGGLPVAAAGLVYKGSSGYEERTPEEHAKNSGGGTNSLETLRARGGPAQKYTDQLLQLNRQQLGRKLRAESELPQITLGKKLSSQEKQMRLRRFRNDGLTAAWLTFAEAMKVAEAAKAKSGKLKQQKLGFGRQR